jgi:hypothetical protein
MADDSNSHESNCGDELIPNATECDDSEYALNPSGNDIDGWDYGDASPDDDLDNADWPKSTPDTLAAIEAQLAAAPRRLLFLRGSHWYVWFDDRTLAWTTDSSDASTATQLLNDAFPSIVVNGRGQSEEAMRELYSDAAGFLRREGVAVQVLD